MIVTSRAKDKIKELCRKENEGLRIELKRGGCRELIIISE